MIEGCRTMAEVARNNMLWHFYTGLQLDDRTIFRSLLQGNHDFSLDFLSEQLGRNSMRVGTVAIGNQHIPIFGVGGRYNEHISGGAAVGYFRRYSDEITAGARQSLLVGGGRDTGYGTRGQILYAFDGRQIIYWHAHDRGKMG